MPLLFPATAANYVFSSLAGIAASICSFFNPSDPSHVPSFFAGFDNGLLYAINPRAFLARCQKRHGPTYCVSVGYRRLKVVSSGDAIMSILSTSPDLLHNDILVREMLYIISGVTSEFARLYSVMLRELTPLVAKTFSPLALGQSAQPFGLILHSQIQKFTQNVDGPVSITQLTHVPLYAATNLILFGGTFPADTYNDFHTLSRSTPYLFSRTLLWWWPSYTARRRLLSTIKGYLEQREITDCDHRFSYGIMKAFHDNGIQPLQGAQLLLSFMFAAHNSTLINSLFLLSFLLGDSSAFARVRTEIDLAVERSGGLEALLGAGPDGSNDSSFPLLTSAIMETQRFTTLHVGLRQANHDFDLKVQDRVIPIKKGELVFGNAHAAHMDATVFPNPEEFVVDRFAERPPIGKNFNPVGTYGIHSFGGGKKICKGRWLVVYQIRTLMIILLHTFDFRPARDELASWPPLRIHPRSIGIIHTEDDISVRLSPRHQQVKGHN